MAMGHDNPPGHLQAQIQALHAKISEQAGIIAQRDSEVIRLRSLLSAGPGSGVSEQHVREKMAEEVRCKINARLEHSCFVVVLLCCQLHHTVN
jgi:hypothetical protein